jgi:hypothetical protein
MNEKRPRWESEIWHSETVPADIVCKTCMFQMPPATIDGEVYERYTGSVCQIFEKPEYKPHEILWEHGDCEHHEKAV